MEAAIRAYSWRRLLCLAEPIYQELLWEFYSTFEHFQTHKGAHGNAIQFRLGRVSYSLSYDDFGRALGLLPPFACHLAIEEPDSPIFRDLQFFERICLLEFAGMCSHRATPRLLSCTQSGTSSTSCWGNRTPPAMAPPVIFSFAPCTACTPSARRKTIFICSLHRQDGRQGFSLWSCSGLWAGSHCPGPVLQHRPLRVHCHPPTPTPFSKDTLRRQLILLRDGDVTWIRGLPRPVPRAPEAEDIPEASDVAARRTTRWTNRRTTPSAASASTSAAGQFAAAPTSYIAEQLASISRQNEHILAGQEHINARLDREHYMMSYWNMDHADVSYPWEASSGHEDFYPHRTGDGGDEN
ncbi:unnamed protein product [Linum trigynum]|uniref:Uncharacterized protein n=1 Tax=Linum trigynum TaxID=586398 RepID=A0AAV2E989_9ROSI